MTNEAVFREVSKLQVQAEVFAKEIESINQKLRSHANEIGDFRPINNIASEFLTLKNFFTLFSSSMTEFKTNLEKQVLSFCQSLQEIKNSIMGTSASLSGCQKEIVSLFNEIKALKTESSNSLSQHGINFSEAHEKLRFHMEQKIEELKKSFLIPPSAILENNNEIMKKVDEAIVDGSNAMLKLKNSDTAIKILERRVETLVQQIRKIELTLPQ